MPNYPPYSGPFAFLTATYLINRLPTPLLHMKSPFQALHNSDPTLQHLHSFGCLCFPWLKPYAHNKLEPKSTPCIFLGYSPAQYAYHCFDPISHKLYTSRHVHFHDTNFPYNSLMASSLQSVESTSTAHLPAHTILPLPLASSTPSLLTQSPTPSQSSLPHSTASTSPTGPSTVVHEDSPPSPENNSTNPPTTLTQPAPTRQHTMTTCSQNGIFKPKKRTFSVTKYPLPDNLEPTNVREAMKYPHWRQAMNEEFDALLRNGMWSLVLAPMDQKIVGCKWLFRIKRNSDGTISRHKARLVAKGYTQTPGTDFGETFAPVVRPQTVKIILTIALANSWQMHQLDINNAFLQGTISEQVFMSQPPGFKHPQFPNYVCRLHKAIYGLRQASCAWHEALKSFITAYGFRTSHSDPFLFIYSKNNITAYFLALC